MESGSALLAGWLCNYVSEATGTVAGLAKDLSTLEGRDAGALV
jgi:hypothetical protein